MAGSLNKVMLIGNLGKDPEVRSFQNGGKVCNFSIATGETWKDKNTGEKREKTDWHNIAIFNENLVRIADGLAVVVRPIGFDRDIALALIPAMAAREVAVAALATVNAIETTDEGQRDQSLAQSLRGKWSLATALAFLAWFVFAPQCISTIAVVRRETNGWKWPGFMVAYLFTLAYLAAGATYWAAVALGL